MSENDRPQDVGRPHRRTRNAPAPATEELLERYRSAMRDELSDTIDELRPNREQLTLDGGADRIRPALAERVKLWDLAIKLGRELANGEELGFGSDAPPVVSPLRSTAPAPKLNARERRALGG